MKKPGPNRTKLKQATAIAPLAREHMRLVIGGDDIVIITGPGPDDPGPK
jgi:hypothetical protein